MISISTFARKNSISYTSILRLRHRITRNRFWQYWTEITHSQVVKMIFWIQKWLLGSKMHEFFFSKYLKIDLDDIFSFSVVHSIRFDHSKWIFAILNQNNPFPSRKNDLLGSKMGPSAQNA